MYIEFKDDELDAIKDSIDKYVKYCNLSKNIQKGFEFILKT